MSTSTPKTLQVLNIVSILLFIISLSMIFFYAPREAVMGEAQRIFYYHVPSAWVSFLSLFIAVITGTLVLSRGQGNMKNLIILTSISAVVTAIAYITPRFPAAKSLQEIASGVSLVSGTALAYFGGLAIGVKLQRDPKFWDNVGLSSIEVGIVFAIMTLFSGMLWARPSWNTWWTWDPRLTTYAILLLIYFAYLMLRQGIEDPDKRARFGSVYGIIGFISVPITYFSIFLWRTIHPAVFGTNESDTKMSLEPSMLQTFIFCNLCFIVFYITFLWHRIRLENAAMNVEEMRMQASNA